MSTPSMEVFERQPSESKYQQQRLRSKSQQQQLTKRSITSFSLLDYELGEGAYGAVYPAIDTTTGKKVAIKKVLFDKTSAREINLLRSCRGHSSIIDLHEVAFGNLLDDHAYLVMELADRDMYSMLHEYSSPGALKKRHVRMLMLQLLQGVDHLHRNGILHRDLKTANILLTENDTRLKIADFGLACSFRPGHSLRHKRTVVTLPYRAPELLQGVSKYSSAIDMWSTGCIMAELVLTRPLFRCTKEAKMLAKIYNLFGQPDEADHKSLVRRLRQILPSGSLSKHGFDLLASLLAYDPDCRSTAEEALSHPWFHERASKLINPFRCYTSSRKKH